MNSLHVQTRVHSLVCITAKSSKKSQLGILLPWENSVKLYQNKDHYRRICIYLKSDSKLSTNNVPPMYILAVYICIYLYIFEEWFEIVNQQCTTSIWNKHTIYITKLCKNETTKIYLHLVAFTYLSHTYYLNIFNYIFAFFSLFHSITKISTHLNLE